MLTAELGLAPATQVGSGSMGRGGGLCASYCARTREARCLGERIGNRCGVGVSAGALEEARVAAVLRGEGDPRFSVSLERGLAILECFDGRLVLGVKDVARLLGMTHSTAHRYVSTMRALGFLEQDEGRRYRLALGVTGLGCSVMSGVSLVEHARSFMQDLARMSGLAVELGVLDAPEVLLVERVGARTLGVGGGGVGFGGEVRLPAYCTALGKVLLAMVPEDVQRAALTRVVLRRRAPGTIKTKGVLRGELAGIRESGLAVCDEEYAVGVVMIAVAVRDERGDVRGALGLSAARSRTTVQGLVDGLAAHLLSAASQISARLGYRYSGASERARLTL
jgi:IclR family pca regulon transcriptional regulator